jgi:type VI secretion system protein ImpL
VAVRAIIGFFKKKWVVQLIGILALGVLIWFVGPLIAIANVVPLASELARGLTIGGLAVLWVIVRLIGELRAARKDRRFTDELAKPEEGQSAEAQAADENIDLLTENFDQALKLLRETRGKGRRGRQHLYELPWYIIIGPPGSGKTTALLNSGLKFPLADRLGNQPIRGVSGTRHCEWLFTDEAVLIDTAGRYTTQESYQAVDAAEWGGFLDLLKKHRPARPINGALVTLSFSDLLQQTEEERMLHAKAIRQRIQELYARLGIRFPIYMLLTKGDLVAGFNDFFADLAEDERAQVWGETFPAEDPQQPTDAVARFSAGYDELLRRLDQRTLKRISEERDVQRRSLILDYPQQMALLKPALMGFLEGVFATSRYESRPLLRGVYLTSGTQEGTPIDRVMGMLAAAFRLSRQTVPVYSGRGKSYFLIRLLKEVVFSEAELAAADPRVVRRRHLLQVGAYAAIGIIALTCIALWTLSYRQNTSAIEQVRSEIERFRAAPIDATSLQANLRTGLPKLNALLAAREIYENYGLTAHFGLHQGRKLEQAAGHAYEQWLKAYFLPVNLRRMADRMTGPEAANPDVLYELLRVYLMLGLPEHMDPKIAAPWIRGDFERNFAAEPEVLDKLSLHLDNLLALKLDPVPLDDNLVALVQAKLAAQPQSIQLYARFKNEALLDTSHDFKLGPALGPQAGRVFVAADGRDVASLTVPGLYTAWGYSDLFLKKSLGFVKDAVTENWVLSRQANSDLADVERLHGDIKNLYLADYQKTWSDLLANVRLRRPKDINQTIELLDLLSRPDTPLKPLLEAVEKNTSLTQVSVLPDPLLGAVSGGAEIKPDERTQKLLDAAKAAGGGSAGAAPDPARNVEAAFAGLSALVRGGADRPAPLEGTLKTLKAVHDQLLQVDNAAQGGALKSVAGGGGAAGGDALVQAKNEFAQLPEPLKSGFQSLTGSGNAQLVAGAKDELNEMLKTGVAAPCKTAFGGRYPFVSGSTKEATLMDFAKFLAPNGVIDQYFQTNLKTFVDVNRPVWVEASPDNRSLKLSPAALRQFQNAARIRDAFFSGGGPAPVVAFELKPLSLDANVATFRLIVDGQEATYRHGPEQVSRLQWPGSNAGSGVRLVFETLDGRQVSRSKEGAWALFRVLDEAVLEKTDAPERFIVTFRAEGFSARYELRASSVSHPFGLPELKMFSCPDAL